MATGVNSRIPRISQRRPVYKGFILLRLAVRRRFEGYNGQRGTATAGFVARLYWPALPASWGRSHDFKVGDKREAGKGRGTVYPHHRGIPKGP